MVQRGHRLGLASAANLRAVIAELTTVVHLILFGVRGIVYNAVCDTAARAVVACGLLTERVLLVICVDRLCLHFTDLVARVHCRSVNLKRGDRF